MFPDVLLKDFFVMLSATVETEKTNVLWIAVSIKFFHDTSEHFYIKHPQKGMYYNLSFSKFSLPFLSSLTLTLSLDWAFFSHPATRWGDGGKDFRGSPLYNFKTTHADEQCRSCS